MLRPMPSPRGTNREALYVDTYCASKRRTPQMAYDAKHGLDVEEPEREGKIDIAAISAIMDYLQEVLAPDDLKRFHELISSIHPLHVAEDDPEKFAGQPTVGGGHRSLREPYRVEGTERQRQAARSAGATDARRQTLRLAADIGTVPVSYSEFDPKERKEDDAWERIKDFLANQGLSAADIAQCARIVNRNAPRKKTMAGDQAPTRIGTFHERYPKAPDIGW